MKPNRGLVLVGIALAAGTIPAAAEPSECPRPADAADMTTEMPAPAAMPSMKMDAPMPTPMARPGTPLMDVMRGAAAKTNCMQPMLGHEQQMMDTAKQN